MQKRGKCLALGVKMELPQCINGDKATSNNCLAFGRVVAIGVASAQLLFFLSGNNQHLFLSLFIKVLNRKTHPIG